MKRLFATLRAAFVRAPLRSCAAAALLLFIAWALYLSAYVVTAFEGRRWDLPAHVYAAPLELYAGRPLVAAEVVATLAQTGYEEVPIVSGPGQYSAGQSGITLFTRPFTHWDGEDPAQLASLRFGNGRLAAVLDGAGRPLPLLRLEPIRLGSLFAAHHEDRILVEPAGIPPLLVEALKAVEDRRFDEHFGLDPAAIARAAWINLRHAEIRQGGSTLTQQLVKSYFLDGRRTLGRKLREAVMAVALELRYDKDELLAAYVNEVYLGQQGPRAIHGFGLASEFWFGKRVANLDLREIALLVALVKGPSYYDPRRHPERARERRNLVLAQLADRGIVNSDSAAAAMASPLGIREPSGIASRYQPAYMDLVRRQLASDYPLDELETGGLRIFTSLDPLAQAAAERELAAGLERLEPAAAGALQGAAIVTRPQTGEVIAMVGGRDAAFDGFNRALEAKRPAGSLIKPVVYLAALQSGGYTLASTVVDEPVEIELGDGTLWTPGNFSKTSHGPVPLVRALAESYNQATVRLGMSVGVDAVAGLLGELGLARAPAPNPSLLLGAIDVSPFEMAQVYNSLANGGFRMPLRAVRAVLDAEGRPLLRYPMQLVPAADAAAVEQLKHALVQVIERGTGKLARSMLPRDLVVAGKTGTSDGYRDSWFAGYSYDRLAVVWIGRDDNAPTGLTGSSGALTVWASLIKASGHAESLEPLVSPGFELAWIDYETGLGSREGCGQAMLVPLPDGTEIGRLPGCGPGLKELGARARRWLDGLGGQR